MRPTIYLANPNFLNCIEAGVTLLNPSEVFVELQLPDISGCYISSEGRLYSVKSQRILQPCQFGTHKRDNQMRDGYRLTRENTKPRVYKTSFLVASVFCENKYGNNIKTVVHHISGDVDDNCYKNLEILSYSEHNKLHLGRKVCLYSNKTGNTVDFTSISDLAEFLDVKRTVIDNALRTAEVFSVTENSLINIIELKNVTSADGQPVYIGYYRYPEQEDKEEGVSVLGAIIVGGLAGNLIHALAKNIKRSN